MSHRRRRRHGRHGIKAVQTARHGPDPGGRVSSAADAARSSSDAADAAPKARQQRRLGPVPAGRPPRGAGRLRAGVRMRAWIERLRAAFVVQGGGAGPVAEAPPVPMRTIVRRFWPYARRYRPWLLLTAVFITLDAAIETAAVWLFKVLVDEVLVPRDFHALVWVGGLFVAVTVAGGLVSFGDDVLSTWVSERFLLDLRGRFYAHLQRLPLDFFEGRRLGDVLSRLTSDIQAIESFVLSGRRRRAVLRAAGRVLRRRAVLAAVGPRADRARRRTALLRRRAPDGEAAQARVAREAAAGGVDRGRRRGGPREHGARPGLRARGDRGGALPRAEHARRSARR